VGWLSIFSSAKRFSARGFAQWDARCRVYLCRTDGRWTIRYSTVDCDGQGPRAARQTARSESIVRTCELAAFSFGCVGWSNNCDGGDFFIWGAPETGRYSAYDCRQDFGRKTCASINAIFFWAKIERISRCARFLSGWAEAIWRRWPDTGRKLQNWFSQVRQRFPSRPSHFLSGRGRHQASGRGGCGAGRRYHDSRFTERLQRIWTSSSLARLDCRLHCPDWFRDRRDLGVSGWWDADRNSTIAAMDWYTAESGTQTRSLCVQRSFTPLNGPWVSAH